MAIPRRRLPQRPSKAHVKATLDAYRLLYGFTNEHQYTEKGQVEIALPRANTAVLETPHVPRGTANRKKPTHLPEWREQAHVVKWCNSHPYLRGHVIKLDNERKRNIAQANVAQMMGLLAGASDLFIAYPCRGFHGYWLEMKCARTYTPSERKKPSWTAQEAFVVRMRKAGYAADFAFGAEHGIMLIKKYLGIVC